VPDLKTAKTLALTFPPGLLAIAERGFISYLETRHRRHQ
jgi:hypothetical protein